MWACACCPTRLSARGPGTGTASFGFGRSQRSATWSNVASKHEDQGSKSWLSAGLELWIAACQIGSEIQCLDHARVACIASCDPQCCYHDDDGCWRMMHWPYAIWDGPSPEELLEEWRPAFMPTCDSSKFLIHTAFVVFCWFVFFICQDTSVFNQNQCFGAPTLKKLHLLLSTQFFGPKRPKSRKLPSSLSFFPQAPKKVAACLFIKKKHPKPSQNVWQVAFFPCLPNSQEICKQLAFFTLHFRPPPPLRKPCPLQTPFSWAPQQSCTWSFSSLLSHKAPQNVASCPVQTPFLLKYPPNVASCPVLTFFSPSPPIVLQVALFKLFLSEAPQRVAGYPVQALSAKRLRNLSKITCRNNPQTNGRIIPKQAQTQHVLTFSHRKTIWRGCVKLLPSCIVISVCSSVNVNCDPWHLY